MVDQQHVDERRDIADINLITGIDIGIQLIAPGLFTIAQDVAYQRCQVIDIDLIVAIDVTPEAGKRVGVQISNAATEPVAQVFEFALEVEGTVVNLVGAGPSYRLAVQRAAIVQTLIDGQITRHQAVGLQYGLPELPVAVNHPAGEPGERLEALEELVDLEKKNKQIIKAIKDKTRAESDSWKIEDAISAQNIKNSEEELRIRKQYGLLTEQQYTDALKRLHGELDSYETDYNARLAKALSDQYGKTWKTSNKEARDMYNYVVSTEDALQQGTLQRNKQLVESYKGLKESLKEYKEQLSAAQKTGAGEDAVKKIQSDIDWATLMMKAIELAAQLRGLDLTDNKKGRTAHNYDSISSLISLLKEMNSEYDKLSKSAYGFAKSNEKVVESFTPAFKEIFGFAGIDISQVDTTSKRATADAMKLVIDTLDKKNLWGKFGSDGGKKARKEFVKAWSQENVEADIDVQVRIREDFGRQIEDAIGDYELTLELQKLNLPKGLAADMWGIEEVDLSQLRGKLDELFQGLKDANGDVEADSLKAYEDKVVSMTTLINMAVTNAVSNILRKKGKPPQKLWTKKSRKIVDKDIMKHTVEKIAENEKIQGKSWVEKIYKANNMKFRQNKR